MAMMRCCNDFRLFGGRSFGHPEEVTLHRHFPGLRENTNVVTGDRAVLAMLSALRFGIDHRLLSLDSATRSWQTDEENRAALDGSLLTAFLSAGTPASRGRVRG